MTKNILILITLFSSFIGVKLQAQTITAEDVTLLSGFMCNPDVLASFTTTGTFNTGNIFTLEVSDENGDFTIPSVTATTTTPPPGFSPIVLTIPTSYPSSNGYLLRVKSSNPVVVSSPISLRFIVQFPITYIASATPNEVLYGTGTTISLSGSQVGIDYRLRNDLTGSMHEIYYLSPISGTGGVINFSTGALTTTTNYLVRADYPNVLGAPFGCRRETDVVTVTVYSTGNPGTGGRYATIQEAVDAATTGQTIEILANRFYDEDVIVDKNLTFTSTGTYQEATIKSIQVNNGITLTIDGNMSVSEKLHMKAGSNVTVNAGNDFVLRSTSAGTALVINEDATTTVTGNVIMERFMPSVSDLSGGFDGQAYHLFSSPFSDAKIAQFGTSVVLNTAYNTAPEPAFVRPFPTFFEYKETNGRANTSAYFNPFISNYKVPTTTDLEVGKGYQANIATGNTIKLNGELNNGDISVTVTNSSGNVLDGYNLIGNPYPSPIDWEAVHSLSTGVEATLYLEIPTSQYDGRFAEYVAGTGVINNGGKKEIAPMQGFFVRTATGGTVNVNNTVRLGTDQRFYKTTEIQDTKEGLVRVALKGNNTLDETTIYFQNGATSNFDGKYDAAKIHKFNSKLSTLYSYNENTETAETNYFAINGLGSFDSNQKLPLAMNILTEGEYEITLRDMKYFHSKHELYLYDSLTDSIHNLRTEGNYKFQSVKGNEIKRFTLLFEINANQDFFTNEKVVVYPNPTPNEFSYSLKTDREGYYLIRLFDATGRMILEENKLKEGAFLEGTINLEKYPTGLYLLQVSDSQKTTTVRVVKE